MAEKEKEKTGYSIISYRVRLYDRHFEWLINTKELYKRVTEHFINVLLKQQELLEQSDFQLLRTLEALCIGTKEMKNRAEQPQYPLENFPKIPLYFRRSAINSAIDLVRKKAENAEPCMVLYKGMYQNFTERMVELKLYNGEKWVWVNYPFAGRTIPKEAKRLSPSLIVEKKDAWLDVPLSFEVSDVRTINERMKTEERICAVSFPDNDVLAVAVILSIDGAEQKSSFIRGGKAKEHRRRALIKRLQVSEESRGKIGRKEKEEQKGASANAATYTALGNLNRHYAHCVSKQILDFCLEQKIKVIVVPNYETSIDFRDKKYLKTDSFRWLGRSIIRNLKYKAFQQGIVVTSIKPYHITDRCSKCGEKIRRYNEGHVAGQQYYGGKLFVCPNGHKGNVAENTAVNVGRIFLAYYR